MHQRLFLHTIALLVAAGAIAACGGSTAALDTRLRQGDQYVEKKQYREALIEYQAAVQIDDRNGPARLKLGRAFAVAGDLPRALEHLVRAADLMPGDAGAQVEATKALLLAEQWEDARTRAENLIKADPTNAMAHVLRGSAAARMRDIEGAIESLTNAVKLDPTRSASQVDLATLRAVTGQSAEAEAGFKQAVIVDPKSVAAHMALGHYYWITGRQKEAEQSALDAVAADPTHVTANLALARIYVLTGRADQAEVPLKQIAAASSDPQPRLTLADYYIARKRPAEARVILEELARNAAAAAAARTRLAGLEYEGSKRAQAYKMIDALIAEQPLNAEVKVLKAGWLRLEQNFDAALAVATEALKADPKSADALKIVGAAHVARNDAARAVEAFTQVLQLRPGDVDALVALANANVALGRPRQAEDFARQAVRGNANDGGARYALARALLAQGKADEAKREFQPVVDAAPDSAEVLALLGAIEATRRNSAGARVALERALEVNPGSTEALKGLVEADLRESRPALAVRRVEAALARSPNSAALLLVAGQVYARAGDAAKGEATLRRAIDVDPSLLEAYNALGHVLASQGRSRLEDARKVYADRVAQKPNDVGALTTIGMILLAQGKFAEAKSQFENTISIDPKAPVALNNLAYFDAEAGTNLDVALNRAQTAKAALPDDADVNDTLGWVYVKRGLPVLAVSPLEQAIQKDPKNPLYHYHLGMAHVGAGDKDRARLSLQRSLQISKSFEGAADAQRALDALGR